MKKYADLIKLYEREDIKYIYNVEEDMLRVAVGSPDFNLIVKYIDGFGTIDSIIDVVNNLEHLYRESHYRIICSEGYDNECDSLNELNIEVTDSKFTDEVKHSLKNNVPYVELLSHNSYCYKRITEILKNSDRVAVNHATGTGKSSLVAKILSKNKYKRVLYLSPTRVIQKQQSDLYARFDADIDYLTYSYLSINGADTKYDLIAVDEYHRGGAIQWQVALEKLFKENPSAKKIGLSATPVRYLDGKRDMSIELFNDIVASELSLVEALARGILPTPKYISCLCDIDKYKNNALKALKSDRFSDEEKAEIQEKLDKIECGYVNQNIIDVFKNHIDSEGGKYLVFCKDKEHMNESMDTLKLWLNSSGIENIYIYSVYSGDKTSDNINTIKKFTNQKLSDGVSLLFSIDILNEGINLSSADFGNLGKSGNIHTICLRATESPIVYLQQIGRVIRTNNNCKPVIFDFVENYKSVKFNPLLEMYKSELSKYNAKRSRLGLSLISENFEVIDNDIEVIGLFETIEKRLNDSWYDQYNKLVNYKEKYGHMIFAVNDVENKNIANWVSKQRTDYSKKRLSPRKVGLLNKIGFVFNIYEEAWQNRLIEFTDYKAGKTTMSGGLTQWCCDQRRLYKDGRLSKEKTDLLTEAGFNFKGRKVDQSLTFEKRVAIAADFIKLNGVDSIRSNTEHQGVNIGKWISSCKSLIKNNGMSEEKIKLLVDNNIIDISSKDESLKKRTRDEMWNESFKRFIELISKENKTKSEVKWCCNWKNKQVRSYRNGTLSKERELALGAVVTLTKY